MLLQLTACAATTGGAREESPIVQSPTPSPAVAVESVEGPSVAVVNSGSHPAPAAIGESLRAHLTAAGFDVVGDLNCDFVVLYGEFPPDALFRYALRNPPGADEEYVEAMSLADYVGVRLKRGPTREWQAIVQLALERDENAEGRPLRLREIHVICGDRGGNTDRGTKSVDLSRFRAALQSWADGYEP